MEYNLADLWEAVADVIPEREALICGERRLSYADTEARANRLAHHLAAHGIGRDDHVALLLYNGTEYLEGMLAALKLRAVPINVNYRYMEEELRYLLDDCDAKAIVSNTFSMEWPPHSGKRQEFPEVDRAEWFTIDAAKKKILKGQVGFLEELTHKIENGLADVTGQHASQAQVSDTTRHD